MLAPSTTESPAFLTARKAAEVSALAAGADFGARLRATPEFAALRAADARMTADPVARAAIEAFGARRAEYRLELAMGALDETQAVELEELRQAMLAVPTVAAYLAASTAFQSLCREAAAVISVEIGIDFAANCRSGGCCG